MKYFVLLLVSLTVAQEKQQLDLQAIRLNISDLNRRVENSVQAVVSGCLEDLGQFKHQVDSLQAIVNKKPTKEKK